MRVLIILILTALVGLGGLGLIAQTTAQPEPTPDIERCWTETGAPCDEFER